MSGFTYRKLPPLPRHNHPLQPQLRIILPRPLVKDRDAEPPPAITSLTPQPKLQIEDQRVRWQPMPSLQKARMILDTALARTAHNIHLMRRQIAKPQPPIAALGVKRLFSEAELRTGSAPHRRDNGIQPRARSGLLKDTKEATLDLGVRPRAIGANSFKVLPDERAGSSRTPELR